MWITENWIPTAAVLGAVGVILLFYWSVTHRGLPLILACVSFLSIGGAYAIDMAVITESERVEQRTRDLANDFVRGDREAVLGAFAEDAFILRGVVGQAMDRVTVDDDLRITDVETKLDGDRASIHFRANATVGLNGQKFGYQPSRWQLDWEKKDDDWRCIKAQRLHPIDGSEMGTLERRQ